MITKYGQFILEYNENKVDMDEELMKFISPTANENLTFLHVTQEEEVAHSIMNNGFRFEIFMKTVDYIPPNDMVTLKYVRYQREAYGDFVMVIQIDKDLAKNINGDFDSISTEENGIFVLPKEYIKGYFINSKMVGINNPHFNPKFNPK